MRRATSTERVLSSPCSLRAPASPQLLSSQQASLHLPQSCTKWKNVFKVFRGNIRLALCLMSGLITSLLPHLLYQTNVAMVNKTFAVLYSSQVQYKRCHIHMPAMVHKAVMPPLTTACAHPLVSNVLCRRIKYKAVENPRTLQMVQQGVYTRRSERVSA
jgi:hypothetical protein